MKLFLSCFALLLSFSLQAQEVMYDICPIKNSEGVPSAEVYDVFGKETDLKNYIGERAAVLVFYRGGWCPYCIRHLSALQEVKTDIDKLGYELIAVTPDDYARLDSTVVRSGALDYKLFSDKNINAIDAFGIGWKIDDELYKKYKDQYGMDTEWWTGSKHHVLPVPAVFIIKEGKIAYQHVNPKYSDRLSPDVLLAMLKSLE